MGHNETNQAWFDAVNEVKQQRTSLRRLYPEEHERREKKSGKKCLFCNAELKVADHEDGYCRICSNTVNY